LCTGYFCYATCLAHLFTASRNIVHSLRFQHTCSQPQSLQRTTYQPYQCTSAYSASCHRTQSLCRDNNIVCSFFQNARFSDYHICVNFRWPTGPHSTLMPLTALVERSDFCTAIKIPVRPSTSPESLLLRVFRPASFLLNLPHQEGSKGLCDVIYLHCLYQMPSEHGGNAVMPMTASLCRWSRASCPSLAVATFPET
jgi:hypothetical protein